MFPALFTPALPDDWKGRAARLVAALVTLVLVIWVLLGRMPPAWIAWARGNEWVTRAVVFICVVALLSRARNVLYALVPGAAVAWPGRLTFWARGRRRTVRLADIEAVHVDLRPEPSGEVFVVEMRAGDELVLCPVRWDGADRLYGRIARGLKRAERQRQREARRARRRDGGPVFPLDTSLPD